MPRPGPRPGANPARFARAKDATTATGQRDNARRTISTWAELLSGLALLGLLLLPSDYRAGAETAHGHALMHLWIDASDGAVHHHHESDAHVAPRSAAGDWLEPSVGERPEAAAKLTGEARPDVADHQDSTPVGGGMHLLASSVAVLVLAAARVAPLTASWRRPESRAVRVLLPPPQWTPLAA